MVTNAPNSSKIGWLLHTISKYGWLQMVKIFWNWIVKYHLRWRGTPAQKYFERMSRWFMWLHHLKTTTNSMSAVKIPGVSVGWLKEYSLQASWLSQILWWSVSYILFPHTCGRLEKNESGFGWHEGGKSGSQPTKGATMRSLRCSSPHPKLDDKNHPQLDDNLRHPKVYD